MIGGGIYNNQGNKQGQWVEPSYNFSFQCQFTFSGNYKDGKRIDSWKILYKKKEIGGGKYNPNGQKIGTWFEGDEDMFKKDKMTSFQSLKIVKNEYKNGLKV